MLTGQSTSRDDTGSVRNHASSNVGRSSGRTAMMTTAAEAAVAYTVQPARPNNAAAVRGLTPSIQRISRPRLAARSAAGCAGGSSRPAPARPARKSAPSTSAPAAELARAVASANVQPSCRAVTNTAPGSGTTTYRPKSGRPRTTSSPSRATTRPRTPAATVSVIVPPVPSGRMVGGHRECTRRPPTSTGYRLAGSELADDGEPNLLDHPNLDLHGTSSPPFPHAQLRDAPTTTLAAPAMNPSSIDHRYAWRRRSIPHGTISGDWFVGRVMFGLLGPVQVQIDARPVHVGGPRSQTILTALLIEPGRVVSTDRLADIVWDEHPPASARTQVQNRVSALRRLLREAGAADAVAAVGTGYVARVSPDQVVERAVERAGRGQDDDAMATVTAALALWRGPAMDGLDAPPLLVAARRLNERRLDAQRLRLGLRLRQGDYAAVVADLAALLAEHPWHEGVAGQLMTALYLAQRQNDALAVFDQMRARLADQLGVDPSPELVRLRDSVLRKEITPDAALPATGTVTVTPPDHDTRSGPLLSREPAPPPRLIPADLADFTGRTAEIQRLVADRDERAVTVTVIHGLAGVGKTALAVHVAHRLRHRFPGAQLYVDLRGHDQPLDPAEALAGFLRALGISGTELPDSLDERAARFRAAVAGRPCLVLLDNAANAGQVRPLLPGAAATVLVTSRRALFDLEGAAQVRLGPLRPPEGLGLFAGVIGAARVAREPGAAARIVRGCGLLPLAVRICAARLAARPHVPLAQTADQLADLAARLDHLQTADRSVRAVFETSYRALAPPARRLLRRLDSLDAEDAPAWLAATALGTDPVEAEDALAGLVEANLVRSPGLTRSASS